MAHIHPDRVHGNLTADEEAELNDAFHEIGCGCPECRPDMHDPREPIAFDAALGGPEAA